MSGNKTTEKLEIFLAIFSDHGRLLDLAKSRIAPLLEQEAIGIWRVSLVHRLALCLLTHLIDT